MRQTLLCASLLLGLAGPALARESAPAARQPEWAALPRARDVYRHFPKAALASGVNGRAVISCEVTVKGRLEKCVVREESPAGYEFGQAAIAMSRYFRMKPPVIDGKPQPGGVDVPVLFRLFN